MYCGTRTFDREQLVFIAEVILCSAMDRIASVLPDEILLEEYQENENQIELWINSALETAGMGLAVLYAQLNDDGLGIGDALDLIDFRTFVHDFKVERSDPDWSGLKPGDRCTPETRGLAEKFVDEMFNEYLEGTI